VAHVTPEVDEGADGTPVESTSKPADDKSTGEETFQFLCPNGHKINTPARLAGELGQCPRCGERFHIPQAGLAVDETANNEVDSGVEDGGLEDGQEASPVIPLGAAGRGWAVPVSALNGQQTMAQATSWMWQEKRADQQLEITLRDGTVIRPTAYAAELNSEQVGLFGTAGQADDMTLRAISWDAIAQVAISGLADEVRDLFNGEGYC